MVRTACFYSYQVNLNCDMHVNIFIVPYLSDYNGAPFYTPYECLLVTYIFSQPGCFIVNSLHIVYEYTVVELLKLFLAMCNLIFFTICQFLNDCNCKEMHACVPLLRKECALVLGKVLGQSCALLQHVGTPAITKTLH